MSQIHGFSAAVQSAEEWIDDITKRLGWQDRARGYFALLAGYTPYAIVCGATMRFTWEPSCPHW
jgi:hypothetical protein